MNKLIWFVSHFLPFAPASMLAVVLYDNLTRLVSAPLAVFIALLVALIFALGGAVFGKSYQSRIPEEGRLNGGLLFVFVYIIAAVGVVTFGHTEVGSQILLALMVVFPFVEIGIYASLEQLDKNRQADAMEAKREAAALKLEERKALLELARIEDENKYNLAQAGKDADVKRKIKLQKAAQKSATSTAQQVAQNAEARQAAIVQRLEALEDGQRLNQSELARQLGTHRNTLGKDMKVLEGAGRVHKNGQGWAVTKGH